MENNGTVHQINPADLLVDTNIRTDLHLTAEFIDSIADLGVMAPILAVRTTDGALRVRQGHRRTAAAIKAGLDTVPVYVIGDDATDTATEIDRLTTQWAENEHRAALTTGDRVQVIEQLCAFGISPAQIAKRTKTTRQEVDAALTITKSAAARQVLPQMSIEHAAVFAEFEDDPDALDQLTEYIGHPQFTHRAQRLRDEAAERASRAAAAANLAENGITVLDQRPYEGWEPNTPGLSD